MATKKTYPARYPVKVGFARSVVVGDYVFASGCSGQRLETFKVSSSDVKEQTVYAKGIKILLSRKVTGEAGELYGRFSEKKKDSNSHTSIKPEIQITDPNGKQIALTEMEYG